VLAVVCCATPLLQIVSVEGTGAEGSGTAGGQVFRIKGDFFGQNVLSLPRLVVSYGPGPDADEYIAGELAGLVAAVRACPAWCSNAGRTYMLTIILGRDRRIARPHDLPLSRGCRVLCRCGAAECSVVDEHVTIRCQSVPGTGNLHLVKVVVDDVASLVPENVYISYLPPSIREYIGDGSYHAFTRGFQVRFLTLSASHSQRPLDCWFCYVSM
jgi:hypothetical protein